MNKKTVNTANESAAFQKQRAINARGWQPVIGLEIHVQLRTQSKIFSSASTAFGATPNTQVHWVDAAIPGTLPVVNAQAIESAIRLGLAINATLRSPSIFARKHYFYPDLPKGYQISQFEEPIVEHGTLDIVVDGQYAHDKINKTITILRAHLEEDAGKLTHDLHHADSAVDLNRAGTPLLEVVTTPCMSSSDDAVAYAKALHGLVRWIGICDGNMQEGSFRVDANVSVRRMDTEVLGTRCEIKNLNSFRFLEKAIDYEIERQIDLIESGGTVRQETRLFDPEHQETRAMRSKEDAHDYRYFPDPDLLPILLDNHRIESTRQAMPELPKALQARWCDDLGLTMEETAELVTSREKADYFNGLIAAINAGLITQQPREVDKKTLYKQAVNWMLGAVAAYLNEQGLGFEEVVAGSQSHALIPIIPIIPIIPFTPSDIAELLIAQNTGLITGNAAKQVFNALVENKGGEAVLQDTTRSKVAYLIEKLDLRTMNDDAALSGLVDEAIAANPKAVEEFRAGKEKALMSLVGAVMKLSKGKANAAEVKGQLETKLKN